MLDGGVDGAALGLDDAAAVNGVVVSDLDAAKGSVGGEELILRVAQDHGIKGVDPDPGASGFADLLESRSCCFDDHGAIQPQLGSDELLRKLDRDLLEFEL